MEEGGNEPKKCSQLLEAEKGKKMDSPLGPLERNAALPKLDFSLERPMSDF